MKISYLITSKNFPLSHLGWLQLAFLWFFFLLITFSSQAQTKIWDKTVGGSLSDELSVIIATPDGGYLLGGTSNSNKGKDKSQISRGGSDYWVVKISAQGIKQWDKTFGGNRYDKLTTMINSLDGGYLLGGFSESGISGDKTEPNKSFCEENECTSDYWIVKIDASGIKVWDKSFERADYDRLQTLVATSDGGFILGGTVGFSTEKFNVLKLDATGKEIWNYNYVRKNSCNQWLSTVVPAPDGGYLLGGNMIRCNGTPSDYWIIKIDKNGKQLWEKSFGESATEDALVAISPSPDGGFLLGGHSSSAAGKVKSEASKGEMDYWIIKINGKGQKQWDKTLGSKKNDVLTTIVATKEDYLLGGSSFTGSGGDKSENGQGGYDFWILKINGDGNKVWDKTYGGKSNDYQSVLISAGQDEYLLGGTSKSDVSGDKSQVSKGLSDYWIIKIKEKKTQTISFISPLITKTLGNAPFALSAQANSALPVTFSLVSGPATLSGNTLTLTGVGTIRVKASQAGNDDYKAAIEVTQTIVVDPPSPVTKIWDKRFGGDSQDALQAIVPTPDGGYLLGGASSSGKSGDKSEVWGGYWLVKLNEEGTKVWDRSLALEEEGNNLSTILNTPDGGYLLGGTSNRFRDRSYELEKITSNGTREWQKTFNGGDNDPYNFLNTIVATPDGGYLVGGYSDAGKGGDKSEASRGEIDYWIIKMDAAGNKLWDKTYGGESNDYLFAIVPTSDGGYLLGGSSSSIKSGEKSEESRGGDDYWLIKIDANGKKVWDKTLGGDNGDGLRKLAVTPDGGYLLVGSSYSGKSGEKSEKNKGRGNRTNDYWVMKVDEKGNKLWDKTLGSANNDNLASILATPDGGFLLGGNSAADISGDKSQDSRGGFYYGDYWVVKIDGKGNKVWDKTLGGSNNDHLTALVITPEGNYLLGGFSNSPIGGDKSDSNHDPCEDEFCTSDYWLVKIQEELPLTAQWDMRFGGSATDNLTSVIKTSDGGYLSGGYTTSGNSGDKTQNSQGKNDYWIVKSDINGKQLWDKRYGGSSDDYLNRVIQTQEGGYLLAGSSLSDKSGDKTDDSKGERDYWLIKVDKQGNKEWDKTLGGSGNNELRKVIQLSTGEYVLGGHSSSPVIGDKSQSSQGGMDYWLVKISKKGSILWDQRYGGDQDETLGSFVDTKDGGFLLGGSTYSGMSGDKNQPSNGSSDYWVVKTDKQGNLVWERSFGGTKDEEAYSLGQSSAKNYFIAGTSSSGKSGDKSQEGQGGKDYWLITLDENGTKLWDRTFGGSQDDELRASTITNEGHYILAGHSSSGVSGDKTQTTQGASDYWVVEVDQDGNKVWDQRFGGSGPEELRTVTQTRDGGLLLGGRSESGVSGDRTQPSQGSTDFWLVKTAPLTPAILVERKSISRVDKTVSPKRLTLTAYPNPFTQEVQVQFSVPQTQKVSLKVFNSQGQEVATLFQAEAQETKTYTCKWNAVNCSGGIYLLRLQTKKQDSHQKLVLTR